MPEVSVCLNMIVKNEAHVIRRCLDSVRPHIDHWVVVDTGSTDGTQAIVREHMRDMPGELHERPWRDFGWNRSEALTLARGRSDYVLVMDADHVLHVPADFSFDALDADGYLVAHRYAGVDYGLPILLADRIRVALRRRAARIRHGRCRASFRYRSPDRGSKCSTKARAAATRRRMPAMSPFWKRRLRKSRPTRATPTTLRKA